ncbi:acyl carrier protein [Streptomyces sp. NPDC049687]|uniref:acyl carrier protein n=1 Tax=Streptomyces sp. NPDC049687 TaxID=3365596 RepID=UPI0037B0DDCF
MHEIEDIRNGLSEIFGRVLQQPTIPTDVSFFDLGGSSLAAIQIVSMVEERHGVSLDVLEVFGTEGLEELSRKVHSLLVQAP